MPVNAHLSILGLYYANPNIFDGLTLPNGTGAPEWPEEVPTELDKQSLIDLLLAECEPLEIRIPDADIMQSIITSWSKTKLPSWNALLYSTMRRWNPIHNYFRTEVVNDSERQESTSGSTSSSSVAGFNDEALKQNAGATASANGNTSKEYSHNSQISGNIGVTTSDQMIAEFRETVQYNIYNQIINDFKRQFCLLVY